MGKKYSEEIKIHAIELYNKGLPACKVAKEIGASEVTVRTWLKAKGITIRNGGEYNIKFDDNFINKVIQMYNEGFNTREIENNLNLKRGLASHLIKRGNEVLRHRGPKSKIGNENFFDNIDNEEKAYYLGWIMADGNVSVYSGQYSLKAHIALKDREIIDKFLEAIKSTNKTKVKDGKNPSYYVSLTSVHMCKELMKLGVVPNKSGYEIFPENIPKDLYRHFVRGVFDGDGITDISKKRSGFVGSKNMLSKIIMLMDETKMKIIKVKRCENIYYFLGGKRFSRKLYDYLYNDSNIWLERKKERLEIICNN
ncbi:transposase family protein [Clostridium argentinense CDC 2741]|uniref:Transposase family protein n=1 Tax=Clostridium argentinense CDC 2741 TaxID=1418104 RepID=A0A0C1UKL1_9CLOT|nr:helix-turn-helix domain-containing protein [Clostridium argentinense]ARC86238.1 endonuclease [Clostridium argentinense]KIE47810.1 transposase family protein [Clostridium argentinense CDC 2741]NFF41178.1 helix-turn-helix domain-containing protein [Clostridium argentinense]NFP51807.1 helix-turn-helix domain-containing protein [Clostridium argentinense]NFP73892.1 helix-turn-helix domain-containing protein [Clostridium argentinense]